MNTETIADCMTASFGDTPFPVVVGKLAGAFFHQQTQARHVRGDPLRIAAKVPSLPLGEHAGFGAGYAAEPQHARPPHRHRAERQIAPPRPGGKHPRGRHIQAEQETQDDPDA